MMAMTTSSSTRVKAATRFVFEYRIPVALYSGRTEVRLCTRLSLKEVAAQASHELNTCSETEPACEYTNGIIHSRLGRIGVNDDIRRIYCTFFAVAYGCAGQGWRDGGGMGSGNRATVRLIGSWKKAIIPAFVRTANPPPAGMPLSKSWGCGDLGLRKVCSRSGVRWVF